MLLAGPSLEGLREEDVGLGLLIRNRCHGNNHYDSRTSSVGEARSSSSHVLFCLLEEATLRFLDDYVLSQ